MGREFYCISYSNAGCELSVQNNILPVLPYSKQLYIPLKPLSCLNFSKHTSKTAIVKGFIS